MTSLLRRVVATFVEPVDRAASSQPSSRPDTVDAPGPRGADGSPPRPAVVFTPPHPRRGPTRAATPTSKAAPPRRTSAPDAIPAASTRPTRAGRAAPESRDASTSRRHRDHPAITDAIVLAADVAAVPVGAACAGELRARARAGAALLCVWHPTVEQTDDLELPWDGADDDRPPSTPAGATTPAARRLAGRLEAHGLEATARGRLAWLRLEPEPSNAATQARRCLAIAGSARRASPSPGRATRRSSH